MGVFLCCTGTNCSRASLPHARGGVSTMLNLMGWSIESSPRPWGCFPLGRELRPGGGVFPTPVGVFPPRGSAPGYRLRLPHARGGVSYLQKSGLGLLTSSPRPWGCFFFQKKKQIIFEVFPTPVGVFLRKSLCGRRSTTIILPDIPHHYNLFIPWQIIHCVTMSFFSIRPVGGCP